MNLIYFSVLNLVVFFFNFNKMFFFRTLSIYIWYSKLKLTIQPVGKWPYCNKNKAGASKWNESWLELNSWSSATVALRRVFQLINKYYLLLIVYLSITEDPNKHKKFRRLISTNRREI